MCKFLIVKLLDGTMFRKGAVFCNDGMKGCVCIDTSKIYAPPNPETIIVRLGNATASTETTTSILLENFLQTTVIVIELDVIKGHIEKFNTMNIASVRSMYQSMKKERDVYPSSIVSPTEFTTHSIHTTEMSRSSQRKVRAPSSVSPADSISQVSTSTSRRLNRIEEDDKHSIAGWIETSSVVSVDSSRTDRTMRPPNTVKPASSSVSASSSRASSRRMSSYGMTRQVAIRE
jgi:hypothetical protein